MNYKCSICSKALLETEIRSHLKGEHKVRESGDMIFCLKGCIKHYNTLVGLLRHSETCNGVNSSPMAKGNAGRHALSTDSTAIISDSERPSGESKTSVATTVSSADSGRAPTPESAIVSHVKTQEVDDALFPFDQKISVFLSSLEDSGMSRVQVDAIVLDMMDVFKKASAIFKAVVDDSNKQLVAVVSAMINDTFEAYTTKYLRIKKYIQNNPK